jgi:hypothetical protein
VSTAGGAPRANKRFKDRRARSLQEQGGRCSVLCEHPSSTLRVPFEFPTGCSVRGVLYVEKGPWLPLEYPLSTPFGWQLRNNDRDVRGGARARCQGAEPRRQLHGEYSRVPLTIYTYGDRPSLVVTGHGEYSRVPREDSPTTSRPPAPRMCWLRPFALTPQTNRRAINEPLPPRKHTPAGTHGYSRRGYSEYSISAGAEPLRGLRAPRRPHGHARVLTGTHGYSRVPTQGVLGVLYKRRCRTTTRITCIASAARAARARRARRTRSSCPTSSR